jgi:trehalose-6-phosphatase
MRQLYLAIDFDGTCVKHDPATGQEVDVENATRVLRQLAREGHKLILWTCREDDPVMGYFPLQEAVAWFQERGIPLTAVNETPREIEHRGPRMLRRKIVADAYIDDRIVGGFPGWLTVLRRIR